MCLPIGGHFLFIAYPYLQAKHAVEGWREYLGGSFLLQGLGQAEAAKGKT